MSKNMSKIFVMLAIALALVLAACGPAETPAPAAPEPTEAPAMPEPTEAPPAPEPTEEPMPAVGSPEHPIKVLFVPSVDANIIVTGGQVMADADTLSAAADKIRQALRAAGHAETDFA